MFFVAPYKVKNPPKRYPYATIGLIALNVLIYALTSESFLVIRREIVQSYALRWGVSAPITYLTSMFLHGSIVHLAGNMLFLWVFGPAVEDRLTIPGYLGLYFVTGFAADVSQACLGAVGGVPIPSLGASGCIMGVLGAYCYLFAWSKVCMCYFVWLWIKVWYGVFDAAAVWVIGAYFALDLINGLIGRSMNVGGGVANFAHVGGAISGAVLVWALRFERDSVQLSQAKAVQCETGDVNLLGTEQIRNLASSRPDDEALLVAFTRQAALDNSAEDLASALSANRTAVVMGCPDDLVQYILRCYDPPDVFSPGDYLNLGKWCESAGKPELALRMYGIIETRHADSPELEMALLRSASVLWRSHGDSAGALTKLETLLSRFPASAAMFDAEDLQKEIKRGATRAA